MRINKIIFSISFITYISAEYQIIIGKNTEKKSSSSKPYISGDDYKNLADHILESDNPVNIQKYYSFNPNSVKDKDIIFVETSGLDIFFERFYPHIKNKFIIISSNDDFPVDGKYEKYLNENKIIIWFGQNINLQHKKLIPIPIGITNGHWHHARYNAINISHIKKQIINYNKKQYLLYVNFETGTAPQHREPALQIAKTFNFATLAKRKPYSLYLSDIAKSKFVMSPHGNGLDCHRTWEALYLNSYPIVLSSSLDPLYKNLPVLILDNWLEITEKLLEEKYIEFSKMKWDKNKIMFEYWKNLILSYKK